MPRVMISYRRVDGQEQFAASLEEHLTSVGITTWFDKNDIPPGSVWENEIFRGVTESDYVVLCLSPEYFESEMCRIECYIARAYGKKILPIVVPFEGNVSVFDLSQRFEETKGVEQLNTISFNPREILGLIEDHETLTQRIVKAIRNPTAIDADYDVYLSFRWRQAEFATRIANDLNKAGIRTFISTRSLDVGADWRRASWSASLKAKVHVVILSPDVRTSDYIANEVLIMRTKKDAQFIPVLAIQHANDKDAINVIRRTFEGSASLSELSKIQWYVPNQGYPTLIESLIRDIRMRLSR